MTTENYTQPQAAYDPLMDWSPLHQILKTGNSIKKLNAWLEQYPYETHRKGYADVLYNVEMGNLRFVYMDDTEASQKKCIRMQKAFLQIYDFAEQVRIIDRFNFANNDIMLEYYPLLKFDSQNSEHIQLVLQDKNFSKTFTKLFHQENFETIDLLEKTLNYPFLEQSFKQQLFIFKKFNKKNVSTNETLLMKFQDNFTKPYYDIIYNYSPAKEEYLNQRGLYIPNQEIVEHYRNSFDTKKSKNPNSLDKDEWDNLYDGLVRYEKVLQYYNMADTLGVREQSEHDISQKTYSKMKI